MFGINQPINGMPIPLLCPAMPKQSKGTPPAELVQLRIALAVNLRACIGTHAETRGLAETAAAEKISKTSGVGKNTILRALRDDDVADDEKNDVRLDTLVKLALYFGVSPQVLLRDPFRSKTTTDQTLPARKDHARARTEGATSESDRAALHRHRRV